MRGDDEEVVAAKRCIAWILHPGPREAIDIEFADRFGSLATDAATLYKLFFSLSLEEDEEALLKLPVFRIGDSTFKVPALAVFRLGASEKLLFVALPS